MNEIYSKCKINPVFGCVICVSKPKPERYDCQGKPMKMIGQTHLRTKTIETKVTEIIIDWRAIKKKDVEKFRLASFEMKTHCMDCGVELIHE